MIYSTSKHERGMWQIYIYIYTFVCVCVCVCAFSWYIWGVSLAMFSKVLLDNTGWFKKMDSITWSAWHFAFTQTTYLLKLVIPKTNVETKTKRTLHSSRRFSFDEHTNAKNLVLHSHFALNWRYCTAVRYASDLAVVFENLGPPLSNVM